MWHTISIGETIKKLRSNLNTGLSEEKVKNISKIYGENKLLENKKESIFMKFIKQFNDFMIIVLILASIVSCIMEYIQGTNDYLDSIIIIAIVILNAIMGTVQEEKASKSLEALKKMSEPTAKVKRDGLIKIVPSVELVPGDYVFLDSGSYVPADLRLVRTNNLKINESSLTRRN